MQSIFSPAARRCLQPFANSFRYSPVSVATLVVTVLTTSCLCRLAVGEECLAGVSFGHWSRGKRFAEVRRPLPVSNLRHIFQVMTDVVVMFIQFPAEHLDCIGSLHTKPRDVLQRIE